MSSPIHANSRAKFLANEGEVALDTYESALRGNLLEAPRPLKAIAIDMGLPDSRLYAIADPERDDRNLPAQLVPALTKASGSDRVIAFLAHACGGYFVRLGSFTELTAGVLKETADYLQAVAIAESDGEITEAEVHEARRQAQEAISALLAHVRWLESRARNSR